MAKRTREEKKGARAEKRAQRKLEKELKKEQKRQKRRVVKDSGSVRERAREVLCILGGTALMAAATNLFFAPASMVPGGFTGLAIIINYVTDPILAGGIPLWICNILLNVPLILLSILSRGWAFVRRTLFAALLFSGWLYLIPEAALFPEDPVLVSIIGGTVMGAGLGVVFLGKATTGGTDTLAALLKKILPHIATGRIVAVLDACIIFLSVWIFGLSVSAYAVISVVLTGRIADGVVNGFRNAHLVYIISESYQEITKQILERLDRGVTLLPGTGMYTREDRPVLLCAVSRKQTAHIRELVYEVDPEAFLILTDAREVRGEGFQRYDKGEL